ncbi:unnamed protein product [Vitrella brassicaformis CCMP3155]|uniref:MIF4G domain-containing protein n=2 Tax=Vitrella brassicaformis TaxID=1169539 RepID=A0A0G4EJA2_VITBC|nr:unnamed protein product [Vitrella brassicaformis CCMP3155]|eukprot:CEL96794.1 unnamed protein product [Vitrella brassicaformis CCMP3155]
MRDRDRSLEDVREPERVEPVTTIVLNCCNLGRDYAFSKLSASPPPTNFDWNGVRKALEYYDSRKKKAKIMGIVTHRILRDHPLPKDLLQRKFIRAEWSDAPTRDLPDVDMTSTLRTAQEHDAQFVCNDEYLCWEEDPPNDIRKFIIGKGASHQVQYLFLPSGHFMPSQIPWPEGPPNPPPHLPNRTARGAHTYRQCFMTRDRLSTMLRDAQVSLSKADEEQLLQKLNNIEMDLMIDPNTDPRPTLSKNVAATVYERALESGVGDVEPLECVAFLLHSQAIVQHIYMDVYAEVTVRLAEYFDSKMSSKNFAKLVVRQCEQCFEEEGIKGALCVSGMNDRSTPTCFNFVRRLLGTLKLLGRLIANGVCQQPSVVFDIARSVQTVGGENWKAEWHLEGLCALLASVTSMLAKDPVRVKDLDEVYNKLTQLSNSIDRKRKQHIKDLIKVVRDIRASCAKATPAQASDSPGASPAAASSSAARVPSQ